MTTDRRKTLTYTKTCEVCGETWTALTRYQAARGKTCSRDCTSVLLRRPRPKTVAPSIPCAVCGTLVHRPPSRLARVVTAVTCSNHCRGVMRGREWAKHGYKGPAARTPESYAAAAEKMRGARNPAWKGGVTYFKTHGRYTGVRYLRAPEWARPMARADGYIMEHRLVMATVCGYLLERTEVVHHLDHDPSNNTPGNLELWPSNGSHKAAEHGRVVPGATCRLLPRSTPAP
jgi:hypothetical protein